MSAPVTVPPPRFYYLHNFQQALNWLSQRYGDLLDAAEQQFVQQFLHLPQPSQALLVRMLMRRGPWFRQSKLQYEEIGDTLSAAHHLEALGWIDRHAPIALDVLFDLHTHAELHTIFAQSLPSRTSRKRDWLEQLQQNPRPAQAYAQWHPQAQEVVWCVQETIGHLAQRFKLMFFGNLRQDWSEFVLADLGVFRYESVDFPPSARAFGTRSDVDIYLSMQACRDALHEASADACTLREQLLQCSSENAWLERRRAKLLMQLGQACEKAQDYATAHTIYADCSYPGARHRQIRVLELQGEHQQALALAQGALQSPESEEELQKLQRMLPRLLRHTGAKVTRRRAHAAVVEEAIRTDLCLPLPAPPCRVEHVLREHWHTSQAPVFYVENTLITALFGLLCWPALFAPLQGAFFHPFQNAPADFTAPDFSQRRTALFSQCLAQLDDDSYRECILSRFADKQGIQNPLVIWPAIHEDLLRLALDCIPAQHLRHMFERLQADPHHHRTGLPDLIRFWPAEQRYELVEVKGPGDKLQDNQVRWLQFFVRHAIPARVCYVTWQTLPEEEAACT